MPMPPPPAEDDPILPSGVPLSAALRPGRRAIWLPWLLSLVVLVGGFLWTASVVPSLPEKVPTGFGPGGEIRGWTEASFASVATGLIIGTGVAAMLGLAAAMVPALSPVRPDVTLWRRFQLEGSHRGLRAGLGWTTLVMSAMFVVLTVQTVAAARDPHAALQMWPIGVAVVLMVVVLFLPLRRWSRWARQAADRHGVHPTPQEEAEERRWLSGGILNDPQDPRAFVPKREGFGVGLTVNVGSRGGRIAVVVFLAVLLIPVALIFLLG